MPELPEVETVKNILKNSLIGSQIKDVNIYYDKIIKNVENEQFINILNNERIEDIKRRGKYLVFILSNSILLSHLRMEGKYFIKPISEPVEKHEHIVFNLFDNRSLRYHDTRKFGVMYLFKTHNYDEVLRLPPLSELGVEPLSGDLTLDYLKPFLSKTKKPIKSTLLNQNIISGLGNIYVNEVLFLSKIHPLTASHALTDEQINNIIDNTKFVLRRAIELGGTTIHSFKSALEVSGRFQNELRIHMQKICTVCHGEVTKIYVEQRGTYICENCQGKL